MNGVRLGGVAMRSAEMGSLHDKGSDPVVGCSKTGTIRVLVTCMILLRLGNLWVHWASLPVTCTALVSQIAGALIQLTASDGPTDIRGVKSRYLHQRSMQELGISSNSCFIQ